MIEGEKLNEELKAMNKQIYGNVIEVGANDKKQAIEIASHGFDAHSFEPSPKSCAKMMKEIESNSNIRGRC